MSEEDTITSDAFNNWKSHPVSNLLLQALTFQKERFEKELSNSASDKNTTDAEIRYKAISVRDYKAMIAIYSDYELMKKVATKERN